MTVKELIATLKEFKGDMEVEIESEDSYTDFTVDEGYGSVILKVF